jgi:hypothetical protein
VADDLKSETAALRSELHEFGLRIEAKLELVKREILNRIFGMIVAALLVNIVAIFSGMFGLAKLLGH